MNTVMTNALEIGLLSDIPSEMPLTSTKRKQSATATTIGSPFNGVEAIAVDSNRNLLIADFGANCIRRVTPDGNMTRIAGAANGGNGSDGGNGAGIDLFTYYDDWADIDLPAGAIVNQVPPEAERPTLPK